MKKRAGCFVCLLLAFFLAVGCLAVAGAEEAIQITEDDTALTQTEEEPVQEEPATDAPEVTSSPVPEPAVTEPNPQADDQGGIAGFFRQKVNLFGLEAEVWMLTAAAAALLLIIILTVLLILLGKKKKRREENSFSGPTDNPAPFITSRDDEGTLRPGIGQQILTVGDEPTMDLTDSSDAGTGFRKGNQITARKETEHILKIRMIYSDRYLDKDLRLKDGGEAAIGRSEEAAIQTNPADNSVSHRHGVFTMTGNGVKYTDYSRNGTRFNSRQTLQNGESVLIPFSTRAQLDIGAHIVLVFAVKDT